MAYNPEYGMVKNILVMETLTSDGKRKLAIFEPDATEYLLVTDMPFGWQEKINMDDTHTVHLVIKSYLDKRYKAYPLFHHYALTTNSAYTGIETQISVLAVIDFLIDTPEGS